MLRPYRGVYPRVASSSYVDPSAQVIGDVHLGERASVWCNVTLRGDVNRITVGDESNIQDNAVLHGELDTFDVRVGKRVTVGHNAVLHGCVVEDECLIGIGAVVLNGATVGRGSVVAAGALVPEGMQIPPGSLVMGAPAKVRRPVSAEETARFRQNCDTYLRYRQDYRDEPA
jgi:carbonic anhydrase/acetyltransferase-like protein (isoleucine patch superfamily)